MTYFQYGIPTAKSKIMFYQKHEVQDRLIGSNGWIVFFMRCLLNIPLNANEIGVKKLNKAGTHVGNN